MKFGARTATGLILATALSIPPLRPLLEGSLIGHVVVQIPLLVLAGALLAGAVPAAWRRRYARLDPLGFTALLMAGFTLAFWLLPRNLDLAVLEPMAGWAKIVTLILLAGVPLGLGAGRLPRIALGALWVKGTAMLFVMGWLYREAPIRLCNTYLADEQGQLGNIMLALGGTSLSLLLAVLLIGPPGREAASRQTG